MGVRAIPPGVHFVYYQVGGGTTGRPGPGSPTAGSTSTSTAAGAAASASGAGAAASAPSNTSNTSNGFSERKGFFVVLPEKGIVVKRWSAELEELVALSD